MAQHQPGDGLVFAFRQQDAVVVQPVVDFNDGHYAVQQEGAVVQAHDAAVGLRRGGVVVGQGAHDDAGELLHRHQPGDAAVFVGDHHHRQPAFLHGVKGVGYGDGFGDEVHRPHSVRDRVVRADQALALGDEDFLVGEHADDGFLGAFVDGEPGVAVFGVEGEELVEGGAFFDPDDFRAWGHNFVEAAVAEPEHPVQALGFVLFHGALLPGEVDHHPQFAFGVGGLPGVGGRAQDFVNQPGGGGKEVDERGAEPHCPTYRAGSDEGPAFRVGGGQRFGGDFAEYGDGHGHNQRGEEGGVCGAVQEFGGQGGADGGGEDGEGVLAE